MRTWSPLDVRLGTKLRMWVTEWQVIARAMISPDAQRLLPQSNALVIDLELTCGPVVTHGMQDIIEFGVCPLRDGVAISSEASTRYIRPVRSEVNSFCTRPTGITPAMLADKPTFVEALVSITCAIAASGATRWVSGGPDHQLLHRQCAGLQVDNPLARLQHFDARKLLSPVLFELAGKERPRGGGAGVGLQNAMNLMDLPFEGCQRSGLVDAVNTARLLQCVRESAETRARSLYRIRPSSYDRSTRQLASAGFFAPSGASPHVNTVASWEGRAWTAPGPNVCRPVATPRRR